MTLVLLQTVGPTFVERRASKRLENNSTQTEILSNLLDEISVILREITEPSLLTSARVRAVANRAGMTERRVKSLWYREAKRVDAHELERLRALRAVHARARVRRFDLELAKARAVLRSDAA